MDCRVDDILIASRTLQLRVQGDGPRPALCNATVSEPAVSQSQAGAENHRDSTWRGDDYSVRIANLGARQARLTFSHRPRTADSKRKRSVDDLDRPRKRSRSRSASVSSFSSVSSYSSTRSVSPEREVTRRDKRRRRSSSVSSSGGSRAGRRERRRRGSSSPSIRGRSRTRTDADRPPREVSARAEASREERRTRSPSPYTKRLALSRQAP